MTDAADDSYRGSRTIVETLFRKAVVEPNRIYGSFCKTNSVTDGFHDFTFAELAKAVDACCWFIKDQFGESTAFEPLLYLGVEDYRYTIILYAAIKCGYKALFVNPKYPLLNILTIMEKTECSKIFYSPEISETINDIRQNVEGVTVGEMAPPLHWLNSTPPSFPFHKTWEDSRDDPIIVLHSSGTTGAPKPITLTNAWMAVQDYINKSLTYNEAFNGGFTYSQFAQCHLGGIMYTILRPLFTQSAASVLGPWNVPSTAVVEVAMQILKLKKVKSLGATPHLLESIVRLPNGIHALRDLNSVFFAGGPLRVDVGNSIIEQGIRLVSSYGSTELGACPVIFPDPQDWEWTHFHPDLHATLEPTEDGAGTHELVFQDEGETINRRRGTYWSLQTKAYRTKDLFVQHPSKPWLWKYYGRTDDIVVLANADKFNPIPVENIIAAHPDVNGVLIAGMNRFPACMLIEPKEKITDRQCFLEAIRSSITKANSLIRMDSRIPVDMVDFLEPGELVRGLKGQIIRKANVETHGKLIDALYQARQKPDC